MAFVVEGEARVAFTNTPGQVPGPPDNGEIKVQQADGYLVTRKADGSVRRTPLEGLLSEGTAQAASIGFPADLDATYARSVDEKVRERAKSFLDFMPASARNGYRAGTAIDLTAYLQKALDSGRDLFMPPNLPTVRVTKALQQKTARQVVEWAVSTPMLYDAPVGSEIVPAWIIRESAEGAVLRGLNVDHQSDGARYKPPANGQIAIGNTILTMADYSLVDRCIVRNAWDNGIGIGKFDLVTGAQTDATPAGATVSKAQTFNCGVGYHPTGEQAGSGVNILCGSNSLVIDCVDIGSLTGFIGDYASGAGGVFFACKSKYAKASATPSTNPNTGVVTPGDVQGGYGFYSGSRHLQIISCFVEESAQAGYWIDGFSNDVHVKGCGAKGCRKQAVILQGGYNTLEDFMADTCSYTNQNQYPAIEVKGTWADGPSFNSVGLILSNVTTVGTWHSLGVRVFSGDGRSVTGQMIGGFLNGSVAPFDRTDQIKFVALGWRDANTDLLNGTAVQVLRSRNRSAAAEAFGDSSYNGNLILADDTDTRKRLALGYDPVRDRCVIQAIQATIAPKPLEVNPSGGSVLVGKAGPAANDMNSLLYLPATNGTPTGSPTAIAGMVPIVMDATNARIYAYFGGAWKMIGFA